MDEELNMEEVKVQEFADWISGWFEGHWDAEMRYITEEIPTLEDAFKAGWEARGQFDAEDD